MDVRQTPFSHADLVVVGGGLAGLSAAALVARAGRSVVVLEQASHLGGRAATRVRQEIHWNLGAHALYCHGHAVRLFTELGVPFTGRFPRPGRGRLLAAQSAFGLPNGISSLLTSRLLTIGEKCRMARLLMTLGKLDTRRFEGLTVRDWLEQTVGSGNLALFLGALLRLSTYCNEPERMSAGVAIHQLKLALAGNVWYLDGGWQTLVDGLRIRHLEMFRAGVGETTGAPGGYIRDEGPTSPAA